MADETNAGAVTLDGLSKRYGDVEAVRELSLEIPAGRFYSLLGPSGCGKTTTLRMIAGFEEPSAGRVLIGGADVTDTPAHKRPVNTVFQSYALFPHMTVAQNVAFGLEIQGLKNNIPAVVAILRSEPFRAGAVHTGLIPEVLGKKR